MTDIIPPLKQTSRFTEHFDILLPTTTLQNVLDIEEVADLTKPRSMSISPLSNNLPTIAKPIRMHSSPDMSTIKKQQSITLLQQPTTLLSNNNDSTIDMNNLSQQQHNQENNHHPQGQNNITKVSGSTTTTATTPAKKQPSVAYKEYTLNSKNLNRADIIIKRLSNWIVILKLTSGWLDEIEKWTSSTSFKKQKKENPDLYGNINKQRKEYHHIVSNFKKECRDKIHQLKANTSLQMEELLLRANETKKCMDHLSQLCKYAEDPNKPRSPEMDPWLGNLHVLRYLKRETTEENRLRELMVPIQRDIKELETKINDNLNTIIQFCAEYQTTVTQYGNTYDQVLNQLLPQPTWQSFIEVQQKDWVDENHIQKNYLQINYPNKQNPYVSTVQKGLLGRRSGVLKQYHKRYYVLTHYGYLHQFKLDDKVKPESSIFITSTTIQPPVNDSDILFSDEMDSHERNNDIHNSTNSNTTNNSNNNINYNNDQQNEKHGFIFEVQRKNKIYHFKTKTSVELIEWCRALNNVATEVSVQKLLEKRKQRELSRQQQQQQQQSKSFDSSSQHLHPQQQQHQQQSRHHHRDIVFIGHPDDDVDEDDNLSQFHSIHTSGEDSSILNTALIESDIISLDIGNNASFSNVSNFHPPSTPSSSPHPYSTTTSATTGMDLSPSQLIPPKVNIQKDESGIYFSSTSSPSSSSSTSSPPPPIPSTSTSQRAIPTYQANLNLNF